MSEQMNDSTFFVAGGTLKRGAASYVKRTADEQLFTEVVGGNFCYVLTSRQMGKSSLMIRTADRLALQGVKTAILDLTGIGGNVSPDQWYLGLLRQLRRRLGIKENPIKWWGKHPSLGNVQRFSDFLHDVVLTELSEQVVIFIDEIDMTLNLEFTDDFFAGIRAMYNARARDPEWNRITFVLLGVASPSDLIKDRTRTPFNIGQRIALKQFSRADALVLQQGLSTIFPDQGAAIFERIYYWTSGHPYLTQKLCLNVAKHGQRSWSESELDALVEGLFFFDAAQQESNFQFIQDRIVHHSLKRQLLSLYHKIHSGRAIDDDAQSLEQNELKLAGLIKAENGILIVRNRIYRHVFDSAWIALHSDSFTDFFIAGGTLPPNAPSYVKRPADDELLKLTMAGSFCYVLTPRQMGKSSLMSRVADELKTQSVRTAIVDLTQIGTGTAEQWYLGLLKQLQIEFSLTEDPHTWSQAPAQLGISPVQRLSHFLRQVVLTEITGKVVIFIDEIDSTLSLPFSDDFFAAIRATYNMRANHAEFNRLTFVLLGVASPLDLIKDATRTPFNIGQGITLAEFSMTDGLVLQKGLDQLFPGQGRPIFKRIYHWTSGHPYLTQHLCLNIADSGQTYWGDQELDKLVEKVFFSDAISTDSNLQFVQNKVLNNPQRRQLLRLYKQVYQGNEVRDDKQSFIHNQLKLAGLLKSEDGLLKTRNLIYRHVFDLAWVSRHSKINWTKIVATVAVSLVLVFGALMAQSSWTVVQANNASLEFFQAPSPAERIPALADLFDLQAILLGTEYDYDALGLFYSQPREEKLALFESDNIPASDVVEVIKGVYTTFGDLERRETTQPLLQNMKESLDKVEQTDEVTQLKQEIEHWLAARELLNQNQQEASLEKYTEAIALNGENPATLYERAQLRVQRGEYEEALPDLQAMVAIANRTSAPTSEATATPTATATATATAIPASPTSEPPTLVPSSEQPTVVESETTVQATMTVGEPTTIAIATSSQENQPAETPTPMPTPTVMPTPTITPTPDDILPTTDTPSKIIGELRSLIQDDPELLEVLYDQADEFEQLINVVPPPTPTPTPSPTATATQTATISPTLSPTASLTPSESGAAGTALPLAESLTASATLVLTTIRPSATRGTATATPAATDGTATATAAATDGTATQTASATVSSTPSPTVSGTQVTATASATSDSQNVTPSATTDNPTVTIVVTETPFASPLPSNTPFASPTNRPSPLPSQTPFASPTNNPSPQPSNTPNASPTNNPSPQPSNTPNASPTNNPSPLPSNTPFASPTNRPSPQPSATAIPQATATPIPQASATPIPQATATPIPQPSATAIPQATATPIPLPTATPIPQPTATPIPQPTATPIPLPTATPIPQPTATFIPPTATAIPPTATAIPPAATAEPTDFAGYGQAPQASAPINGEQVRSQNVTFEWQWNGGQLVAGHQFLIRGFRDGQFVRLGTFGGNNRSASINMSSFGNFETQWTWYIAVVDGSGEEVTRSGDANFSISLSSGGGGDDSNPAPPLLP